MKQTVPIRPRRLRPQRRCSAPETVSEFLGPHKFRDLQADKKNEVGATVGLAWTEVGGSILTTEAAVMEGKGKLQTTGKLGDVMQESAHAAMSYVRSRAHLLGLPRDFYRNVDIHVHVPEGAIPKDGPSAGITIATSICSALTNIPGSLRSRHDRRDYGARPRAAHRRIEGKGSGGASAGNLSSWCCRKITKKIFPIFRRPSARR